MLNWNSICASSDYAEMSDARNVGFAESLDLRQFLFEKSASLACLLSDMYGYNITAAILPGRDGFPTETLHVFCACSVEESNYFVDARGLMKNISLRTLLEPFTARLERKGPRTPEFFQFATTEEFLDWAGRDFAYRCDETLTELSQDPMFKKLYRI